MSKNINRKYKNKKIQTKFAIYIILITLALLQAIIIYTAMKYLGDLGNYNSNEKIGIATYEYDKDKLNIIDDETYNVNILLNEVDAGSEYKVIYGIGENNIIEENIENGEKNIQFSFELEGENNCHIQIKKDDKIIEDSSWNKTLYYIRSYESQFLDGLSKRGVQVHYRANGSWEQYAKSLPLIKSLGAKNIRSDIFYTSVRKKDGDYRFDYYDEWIKEIEEKYDFNILLEFNGVGEYFGSEKHVDTEEELKEFVNFAKEIAIRYPKIINFEVLNEPNIRRITI